MLLVRGDLLGQVGEQRVLEHGLDGHRHPQQLLEQARQPGTAERIAAQAEEVVPGRHRVQTEDVGDRRAQHQLQRAARTVRGVPHGLLVGGLLASRGGGQQQPVDLAVAGQRQLLQHGQRGRHHVTGELRGEPLQDRPGRVGGGHDEGVQPPHPVGAGRGHHHGRLDLGVLAQYGLDLAQLDPVALDLHLEVVPAEDLDAAVGQVPPQVTGQIGAFAALREVHEAVRGALRVVPVPQGEPDVAGHGHLADHPERALVAGRVDDVVALVGDRLAVRDARPGRIDLADRLEQRPADRLGRTARTHHLDPRALRPQPVRQRQRDPVAGEHGQPQGLQRPAAAAALAHLGLADEQFHQDGHGVPQRDLLRLHQIGPHIGLGVLERRWQYHGSALRQHPEHVVDRGVEVQPGDGQQPVPGADLEALGDIADQVDHTDVVDHHALGLTRRARSEDRVREVRRGLRGVGPGDGGGLEVLVHPVAAGRGGPADPGVQPGLGEDPVHLGLGEQPAQPLRRHGRVQRQIGGAGGEDPVHRGVLLPPLLHHDGDQLARSRPVVPQRVADPPGVRGQFGVAQAPPGGVHHGLGLGRGLGLPGEQLVQGGVRDLPGSVVDLAAQRPLGRRDQVEAPGVQGLRVPGEPLQQVHVHAEGGVDEAGRERPVDEVPDDAQFTGQLAQLHVERDLRGLGDRVHLPAQVGDGPAHRVVEQAGDDDRHAGRRAHPVQPGQFAQHPHAVEGAVLRVAGELVAQGVGPVQEGRARTVGGEHHGVGEVAEHTGDVRVHRRTLEDRVVDGEVRLLRPAPDHLGEGCGEQDRRGQPRFVGPGREELPVRGESRCSRRSKRTSRPPSPEPPVGSEGAGGRVGTRSTQ